MQSLSRLSTIVISFLIMVFIYLITQGVSNYYGFKDSQEGMANRSVNATANEISIMIRSYRRMVRLFADQYRQELIQLLNDPEDVELAGRVAGSLGRFLPEYADFAVADTMGTPLFTLNASDLGTACRMELSNFASSGLMDQPAKIHSDEHGSHFDIVVELGMSGGYGMLFVSFKLERLEEILRNGQASGHHMLLLKQDNPHLLALALEETSRTFSRPLAAAQTGREGELQRTLNPEAQSRILATSLINGTQWIMADLPVPGLFSNQKRRIALETLVIFLVFMGVGLTLLFLTRREARRSGETALTIEGIEAERRRIAMDLHDQVLGEITHTVRETSNYLEVCSGNPQMQERINRLRDSLGIMADGIRVVIDDLHPQALNILGLEAAFRAQLEKLYPTHMKIDWSLDVEEGIDAYMSKGQRLNLYRILLEVSQNTLNHAKAGHFSIIIRRDGHARLDAIIEDDGIGFNPKRAGRVNSLGIANVQTRAHMIGAEVEWMTPESGQGTRFELKMDLQK